MEFIKTLHALAGLVQFVGGASHQYPDTQERNNLGGYSRRAERTDRGLCMSVREFSS